MYTATDMHLVFFSHLRWNFLFQRPRHLASRSAGSFKVYFVEEPVFGMPETRLEFLSLGDNLEIIVPHFRTRMRDDASIAAQKELLTTFFDGKNLANFIFWYTSPLFLPVTEPFRPALTVYDCVHEPAALRFSQQMLKKYEDELFDRADLVFTSGYSLYEAKRRRHGEVHHFPNSVDVAHFFQARPYMTDPTDQASIPHPRIGYFGAIDDRIDVALLEGLAHRKPEWHFVMVGPVCNIHADTLPRLRNIHYLGTKSYYELPSYISGWDLAIIPFVHNESTRYLNPIKTAEYLAAGKPVITTPITDILRQYGRDKLVNVAGTQDEFIRVASLELGNIDREEWLRRVNEFLPQNSWDKTWQRMLYLMTKKLAGKERVDNTKEPLFV